MLQTHAEPTIPTPQEALRAGRLRHALGRPDARGQTVRVQVEGAGLEELPPVVARLLLSILEKTAAGEAVTLLAMPAEIGTQEAAYLLNVSRPFVVGMIEKGILPARMVGSQRRLPLSDVLAYKADNRAKRREVLREMVRLDQELGLI